ncbi:MAG: hypothetical protein KDK28_13195 [Maritimibacter sp.]|nr:hypothetical protein [Maritimibacter sp.]
MITIARIKEFLAREDGAVSADFVLLTGGVVAGAVFSFGGFSAVTMEVANFTSSFLESGVLLHLIH